MSEKLILAVQVARMAGSAAPGGVAALDGPAPLEEQCVDVGQALRIRTLLWDKDQRLPAASPLRSLAQVTVCEPALAPSPGAVSLLFPVADDALDTADPTALAAMPRPLPLVYVGNQYDRDEAFAGFFAPAAARHSHRVAGKWTRTAQWPHVTFTGRITFSDVKALYESSLATILLLPDRYAGPPWRRGCSSGTWTG